MHIICHNTQFVLPAILQNEEALQTTEAWKLREICLEPLQLALESRAKKLAYHALTGIQVCDKKVPLKILLNDDWLIISIRDVKSFYLVTCWLCQLSCENNMPISIPHLKL